MSESVKRILIIVCAAVLIAAVLYSLRDVFAFAGYSYEYADRYQAGGSEIAGTVRNLDIGWINGKVRLAYRSGTAVSLSETSDRPISGDMQLRWWLDGDTLRIRDAKAGFRQMMLNTQRKELTVTLPEGAALGDVAVSATSADLEIPSLQAESLILTTTSGNVIAAAAAGQIRCTSTSGDLVLTVPEDAREILTTSTSGSVRIEAQAAERLKAVSTSGNIAVTAGRTGTLEMTSTSGRLEAKAEALSAGKLTSTSGGITVNTSAVDQLSVSSTSGSVTAFLPETPGFAARVKTTSGRFDYSLPLTRSGSDYVCGDGSGSVSISTTSGDVRIDAAR